MNLYRYIYDFNYFAEGPPGFSANKTLSVATEVCNRITYYNFKNKKEISDILKQNLLYYIPIDLIENDEFLHKTLTKDELVNLKCADFHIKLFSDIFKINILKVKMYRSFSEDLEKFIDSLKNDFPEEHFKNAWDSPRDSNSNAIKVRFNKLISFLRPSNGKMEAVATCLIYSSLYWTDDEKSK